MAIKRGFAEAEKRHFDYVVTIDSDGQHYPDDIPYLINTLRRHPGSIIIGSRDMEREGIPGKSSFGNRFSNFWFKFDTGLDLPDTQSGYRIYPLKAISRLKLITWRFEFEVEILVKAAWRGISIKSVPVRVYYPPGDLRVSHFLLCKISHG
jgi:glycosyltransferase involved in cell wall biosynthesis